MISEMEVNFSGAVAAKMETGDFRALARVNLQGVVEMMSGARWK